MKMKKKKIWYVVLALAIVCIVVVEQRYCFRKLLDAADHGDVATIRTILRWHPWMINWKDGWGYSALHHAASAAQPEAMSLLLAHGADIHTYSSKGRFTPLQSAKGHLTSFTPEWRQGQEDFMRRQEQPEEVIAEQMRKIDAAHTPEKLSRLKEVIAILESFENSALSP